MRSQRWFVVAVNRLDGREEVAASSLQDGSSHADTQLRLAVERYSEDWEVQVFRPDGDRHFGARPPAYRRR